MAYQWDSKISKNVRRSPDVSQITFYKIYIFIIQQEKCEKPIPIAPRLR